MLILSQKAMQIMMMDNNKEEEESYEKAYKFKSCLCDDVYEL